MERFLSPLRASLPDIDVDVESARRRRSTARSSTASVASACVTVSMMDTYRVRHADPRRRRRPRHAAGGDRRHRQGVPHIRARDARSALRDLPELRATGLGDGGASTCSSGWWRASTGCRATCDAPLRGAALRPHPARPHPRGAELPGYPMSQFDKEDVEDLGLLKLDVLGIRMQSAMAHAVAELRRVDGVPRRPRRRGAGAVRRPHDPTTSSAARGAAGRTSRSSHPDSASSSASPASRPSTTSSPTSRCSDPARSRAT